MNLENLPFDFLSTTENDEFDDIILPEPSKSIGSEPKRKFKSYDFMDRAVGEGRRDREWGDMGENQPAVAAEIRSEMERSDLRPDTRAILSVLLRIADGELPRPLNLAAPRELLCTSWRALANLANVEPTKVYKVSQITEMLERFVPRLEGVCYAVETDGENWRARNPLDAEVAEALHRMEKAGEKIPRSTSNAEGVAVMAFCESTGISYHELRYSEPGRRRLRNAAERPGALGERIAFRFSQADYDRQSAGELQFMRDLFAKERPLPAQIEYPNKIDRKYIHDMVDPSGPAIMDRPEIEAHIKMHREAFGLQRVAPFAPDALTWGEFADGAKRRFAEEKGQKSLDNFTSALNRVMRTVDADRSDWIPGDMFEDALGLTRKAADTHPPLSGRSVNNLAGHVSLMALYASELGPDEDGYPRLASTLLDFALRREGISKEELMRRSGIGDFLLEALLRGRFVRLPEKERVRIDAVELVLRTEGALARRLQWEVDGLHRGSTYFRTIPARIRHYMPANAHELPDEELKALWQEIQLKVIRQDRTYSRVIASSKDIWRDIPELPADCPAEREIDALVRHKRKAIPSNGERRRGTAVWGAQTGIMNARVLRCALRWAALPVEGGGLGVPVEKLSLSILLDHRVALAYLDWRAGRFAAIARQDGRPRGALLTLFDTDILRLFGSLLDRKYGWITQQGPSIMKPLDGCEIVARRFDNLELVIARYGSDEDGELFETSDDAGSPILDHQAKQRIALDFAQTCEETREQLLNARTFFAKLSRSSREPFEPIKVILSSPDPLGFLTDIQRRALADLPDEALHPHRYAIALRNVLVFTFLVLTTLRSKNLRNLTVGDGGHVSFDGDGVRVDIPFDDFKNLGSWRLFGRPGRRMDYQRLIEPDFYDLAELLGKYLRDCRPMLISNFADTLRDKAIARGEDASACPIDTDKLFPVASLGEMGCSSVGEIVRELTRRYHVLDEETGRARPGFHAFGPHAVRDVLATHIIRTSDDPNRWEWAADLLQTSPDMVRTRYAFQEVAERTGRADPFFKDQQSRFRKDAPDRGKANRAS